MKTKYILTEETLSYKGHTLHRIKAIIDFGIDISRGDLGGWVESENNLSQEGECWISEEAKVYGNARVSENARIEDFAEVYDNAKVCDSANVFGNAKIYGYALVYNETSVFGNARVYSNARIHSNAVIYGSACVYGKAIIGGNAKIYDYARVHDKAWVVGYARISGQAEISMGAVIEGDVKVFDTAKVSCIRMRGPAIICGNAIVKHNSDYMIFHDNWNTGEFYTWTKSNNMWKGDWYHFYGTGEELIKKAYRESKENGWYFEQIVKFAEELANHKKS